MRGVRRLVLGTALSGTAATAYVLLVRGALTLDLGIGRSLRPLGPLRRQIEAPCDTVFDVIAAPYLGRTPHALATKLRVLERGTDMVLAEHVSPIYGRLIATTVETVRFESPHRISFRLLRGPVPYVTETFELSEFGGGTAFVYRGELGTDLWSLGRWWGNRVARVWEQTVETSLDSIQAEAERRARVSVAPPPQSPA